MSLILFPAVSHCLFLQRLSLGMLPELVLHRVDLQCLPLSDSVCCWVRLTLGRTFSSEDAVHCRVHCTSSPMALFSQTVIGITWLWTVATPVYCCLALLLWTRSPPGWRWVSHVLLFPIGSQHLIYARILLYYMVSCFQHSAYTIVLHLGVSVASDHITFNFIISSDLLITYYCMLSCWGCIIWQHIISLHIVLHVSYQI